MISRKRFLTTLWPTTAPCSLQKELSSNVLLHYVHLEARDWSLEIECNGPDEYILTDRPVQADPDEVQPPTPRDPVSKQEMEQQVGAWLTRQSGS